MKKNLFHLHAKKQAKIFASLFSQGKKWLCLTALILINSIAYAAVDIEVWHTLPHANQLEFEKLIQRYNKEQDQVFVKLRHFDSQQVLKQSVKVATAAKKLPHLVQLKDNHSPEVVAERKIILPLYELLAKYPIKDLNWFLPATSSFIRDSKGHLLAFPWMAEIPVMFYNMADYKKAGLNPQAPAHSWSDLQVELLKLRDTAHIACPYALSHQVSIHLENLASMNNQFYISHSNGLKQQKAVPSLQFDTLAMRHISLMATWKRSQLLVAHTEETQADQLFATNKCAVLMTGSGALGEFMNTRSLSFGVAPLPYYPQVTAHAGRPFVTGAALWAIAGHPKTQEKATASFLAWLSKPVIATAWHQHTGYLPLTAAAFRAADVSFYNKVPGAQRVVSAMNQPTTQTNRGFRMPHYYKIMTVLNHHLDNVLEGKMPSVAALNQASIQAKQIAHQP